MLKQYICWEGRSHIKHSYQNDFLKEKNLQGLKGDIRSYVWGKINEKWKWTNVGSRRLGWADSVVFWIDISNPFTSLGHVFINDKNGSISVVIVLLEHFNTVNHIQFSIAQLSISTQKFSTEFRKEINLCWVYNRRASPQMG